MSTNFHFKKTLRNCKILSQTDLLRLLKTDKLFSCHTAIFSEVNCSLSMHDIYSFVSSHIYDLQDTTTFT